MERVVCPKNYTLINGECEENKIEAHEKVIRNKKRNVKGGKKDGVQMEIANRIKR